MDLYLREGGANWKKSQTTSPQNRYHTLQAKMYRPNWESNPRPVTLVNSLLGQKALALTHFPFLSFDA